MSTVHWQALGDVLREQARSRPGAGAAVCGSTRLDYRALDARVDRLVAVLVGAGFTAGDRLLWLGQNCHRLLEAILAAARLGGACCPANWRLSPAELAFIVDDCNPRVVITQQHEIGERLDEGLRVAHHRGAVFAHDDSGPEGYEARLLAARPAPPAGPVDPETAALLLYTAAFEGRPNGALLSHTAVITQALVVAAAHAVDSGYVYLNAGPMFHVATLMLTAATLVQGGINIFTPRASPEELLRLIATERCRGAYLVEPTIGRMAELNADRRYDIGCLVSAPARPEWDAMVDTAGSPFARRRGGYGQTELFGMLTFRCFGGSGSAGLPSPIARFRIVDAAGAEVPDGQTGEIVVRGPLVMLGYHNRPELNRRRRRGGWHHTNDLGRREADGSLTFVGPLGRLIKSGVENVYPAEVEACLRQHPAVAECCVIGVPDPVWRQSVQAVVALGPGAAATEEELIEHCRARIGSYKKPRSVVFVSELPRAGGQIDYLKVDREHGGGAYPGEGAPEAQRAGPP